MQRGHVMTGRSEPGNGERMTGALDRRRKPRRYGFLNLMRRVDAQLCDTPAGSIWQPRMEKFRLGQTPTMTFAPRKSPSQLAGWTPAPEPVQPRTMGAKRPVAAALYRAGTKPLREPSRSDAGSFFQYFSPPLADAVLAGMAQRPVRWWRAGQTGTRPFCVLYRQSQRAGSTESAESPLSDHVRWRPPPIWYANRAILTGWPPRWRTISACLCGERVRPALITVANDEITRLGTPAQSSVLGNGALIGEPYRICSTNSG